jgi:hypothetical protein
MTMDEARAALGEPGDVSVSRKPVIWRYGCLELAFEARAVTLLSIEVADGTVRIPELLDVDLAESWGGDTSEVFTSRVQDLGCRVEEYPLLTFADQSALRVVESQVLAVFGNDHLTVLSVWPPSGG